MHLNDELVAVAEGRTQYLIVNMPPQKGKSTLTSLNFPAWYKGRYPDKSVILASYEARFAGKWGRRVRDALRQYGPSVYGVDVSKASASRENWVLKGYEDAEFNTAGVDGPITGKSADVIIIDDPIKSMKEADSPTVRENAWQWFWSSIDSRANEHTAIIITMTRWHEDDLVGRLLADPSEAARWRVVSFPALAEEHDILGRAPGDPLWPEKYPLAWWETKRQRNPPRIWSAMYQQRPAPAEGNMFKRAWFANLVNEVPKSAQRVRWWDKAASTNGDYTVGVLMARTSDGLFWVEDVVRGQWLAHQRDATILKTAQHDADRYGNVVAQWSEQEPGSGGKDSAGAFKRLLAGYPCYTEPSTGSKEVRAEPFAAQCGAGNVRILRGDWNRAYIDELCGFPTASYDDQVDGSSGAFNKLCAHSPIAYGESLEEFWGNG